MELLPSIGMGAVAVLVLGWLTVCFQPAGPRRASIEWLAAAALYLALLCLFVSLVLRALEADNRFAAYAFGFLVAFFGAGLAVSLSRTLSQLRGRTASGSSAAT
jgi:hypothetical protein